MLLCSAVHASLQGLEELLSAPPIPGGVVNSHTWTTSPLTHCWTLSNGMTLYVMPTQLQVEWGG